MHQSQKLLKQLKSPSSIKQEKEVEFAKAQLKNNIDRWDCKKHDEFNVVTYSWTYCELDCTVLRKGCETYRNWMLEITELDIDYYVTIQSLAGAYKLLTRC